jgi:hypothetical protein
MSFGNGQARQRTKGKAPTTIDESSHSSITISRLTPPVSRFDLFLSKSPFFIFATHSKPDLRGGDLIEHHHQSFVSTSQQGSLSITAAALDLPASISQSHHQLWTRHLSCSTSD